MEGPWGLVTSVLEQRVSDRIHDRQRVRGLGDGCHERKQRRQIAVTQREEPSRVGHRADQETPLGQGLFLLGILRGLDLGQCLSLDF